MTELCTVCGTEVKQNYCSNCGQFKGRKEITFLSMIKDMFTNILDVERSVVAGIFKMFSTPFVIINNYWEGNRNYYPSPGKVLIYALAVAVIHLTYVNSNILGATLSSNILESQILFWAIFFPLLSLCSLLSFLRKKKSFTKHLVSIIYISGSFFILLTILGDIQYYLAGDLLGPITIMIFVALVLFWNSRVMENGKGIWIVIRGWLVQVAVFVTLLILIGFIITILNPESLEVYTQD